jgi:hypothetical protein
MPEFGDAVAAGVVEAVGEGVAIGLSFGKLLSPQAPSIIVPAITAEIKMVFLIIFTSK